MADDVVPETLRVRSADGADTELILVIPQGPVLGGLLWVPALGVTARNYLGFAQALAARGIAVALHEFRGAGSSSLRASRRSNWGYRELLEIDLPASVDAAQTRLPEVRWHLGGHSLGGQFAALVAATAPDHSHGVLIVACGAPYWRRYPGVSAWVLRTLFVYFDVVSALVGYFPGRKVGFAGNEARQVMRDWGNTGRSGRYEPQGMPADLDARLARYAKPVFAVCMTQDRFAPRSSVDYLLSKLAAAPKQVETLGVDDFASRKADHFSWLKDPAPVAERIVGWWRGR